MRYIHCWRLQRVDCVPVYIEYQNSQAKAELSLGLSWSITPNDDLLFGLARLLGDENVSLQFDHLG